LLHLIRREMTLRSTLPRPLEMDAWSRLWAVGGACAALWLAVWWAVA
jgi:hypothetical protein